MIMMDSDKNNWVKRKASFFLSRLLIFLIFFLLFFPSGPMLPWRESLEGTKGYLFFSSCYYFFFLLLQWYYLGREIDYRFKIYYKVHSALDRPVYRLLMGMMIMLVLFNWSVYFPSPLLNFSFWGTWLLFGLFYSWPTRGKIVEEGPTRHFAEFRYLDPFEKLVLLLTLLMVFLSLPQLDTISLLHASKQTLLKNPHVTLSMWNYLRWLFSPFWHRPEQFTLMVVFFFYFWGIGISLLAFYAFLRHFFSRRIALLGPLAFASSWALIKDLEGNLFSTTALSLPILTLWAFCWFINSSSYRSALFIGLLFFYALLHSPLMGLGVFLMLIFTLFSFYRHKTSWFKKQVIKYFSIGPFFAVLLFFYRPGDFVFFSSEMSFDVMGDIVVQAMGRKGVYVLSLFAPLLFVLFFRSLILLPLRKVFTGSYFLFSLGFFLFWSLLLWGDPVLSLHLYWNYFFSFCMLIPLEVIFCAVGRMQSKKNLIYALYILLILLDSHFEGRVKIFLSNLF